MYSYFFFFLRYVQHVIEEQIRLISELIVDRGGWVFIAGNAKQMPDLVMDAIRSALITRMEEDQAGQYIKRMQNTSRLQLETWS